MDENVGYSEKLTNYYDAMYPIDFDTSATIDFLETLVPPRSRFLELGVGNGRIALPLADRGHDVLGVDSSENMLQALRERDANRSVRTVRGDFIEFNSGEKFDVITVVLNTFFAALTKERQIEALANVKAQLEVGGKFVLEAFEPTQFHAQTGVYHASRVLKQGAIMIDAISVDRANQILVGEHTILDNGPVETTTHVIRYAFPLELDLLAEIAGLRLVERFGGWDNEPYTHTSPRHISVYAAADAPNS
ncbi:class I SAM-dependent methyltransferase (plasmid) [Arthrobacter sp. zg-Y820]|uniref:class I SAM-dependent methyltransferase n=1 Tax=unclassified Arthrobacter TaxID=235627 RepID=UPI001E3C09DF|nr:MULTISPECIES: class I SAM-dependent methyltransferase [unclassified Arthrobacter]MCC9198530.1 class I SAM-dependent methyltransferase [Arthrobacter sp. zg-Y820]MDK1281400.1 class I SAM-dependent methyltransferase [Arthrobacter sp. zg.Y820]WIB11255.1 class I SAM-dependent methyltransferase [Arthrobacter sp. zg-Y820]